MEEAVFSAAVVDDDAGFRKKLKHFLQRIGEEETLSCRIDEYESGLDFLSDAKTGYQLIFLDVEMPHMDGIETARRLRKKDPIVGIIFVTNMAQYAINGYEVNAIDYIVKPVEYFTFAYKFKKALRFCETRREQEVILVQETGVVRILYSTIRYLTKDKNYIVYHTTSGDYLERGTMAEKKEVFLANGFAECSSGCVVNLRYVTRMEYEQVWVGEEVLSVSRSKRKSFSDSLLRYLGR
jgi:DNA-binding LytR/AlgR family response regulator